MSTKFDVALSFASEDRNVARDIAEALQRKGKHIFFDEYITPEMYDKGLSQYLNKIYEEARLCIVIYSEHYKNNQWSQAELRSLIAQAREHDSYTLLTINTTGNPLPSSLLIFGSIEYNQMSPEQIANVVEVLLPSLPIQKINRPTKHIHVISRGSEWSVKTEGASRAASLHSTQKEAVEAAHLLAYRNEPSEIIVHLKDGSISSREPFKKK